MSEPMAPASEQSPTLDGQLRSRADGTGIEEAFLPSPCVQSHAANLMPLPGGDLGCVWFGGTQEGKSDISIYFSRLPRGARAWTTPVRLSDDADRSEQNPILFPAPDGTLWLLHTAQRSGNQDTSVVRRSISRDAGATWGPADVPIDEPGTFVRQPLVVLDNGDWLLPCFLCRTAPGTRWLGDQDSSVVRITSDQGRTWREVTVPQSTGLVHMNIVPGGRGGLVALFRSRWADNIYRSRSSDGGRTWSPPIATTLPNNNSSIQATRLADGRIALVFNNIARTAATERRASLYDEIEDDDGAIETAAAPQVRAGGGQAFWGTPRAPVTLAVSADDGETWRVVADLETGDGYCLTNNSEQRLNRELSYPSIAQSPDGWLEVAFTYHRQAIKHLRVPLALLERPGPTPRG
ncbi:MAG: exo-alpha-sialidase [Hyphomicrobiaceae bacterium]